MVPVLHAWVKSQRGKKTLLTLGSLWASMLPSISLHSASNLCTCKKKKIWNHGKVCYCQFQLNDHLKLFLSITHFLWHLIFIYKLFNNSDNKIGVRILGCYHKKEFLYLNFRLPLYLLIILQMESKKKFSCKVKDISCCRKTKISINYIF